jgi:NAD(P)-dependent dehydrogenase (short-subunit alcohol dehydrogenase family)
MSSKTITLITGANRGMGFELAKTLSQRGQQVILGSRDLAKGQSAQAQLADLGLTVDVLQLDVTQPDSVTAAAEAIDAKYGYLSILVNNAGAVFDRGQQPSNITADSLRADFELNYFGLIDVTQKLLPLLKLAPSAKIINVSSMMGSKTEALNPDSEVYRASAVGYQSSKAAANMYTVQLAKELKTADLPITVNAVDPGMVATEFGGVSPDWAKTHGAQSVDFGIARMVELATAVDNDVTATFSNTHGEVAW